MQLNLSISEVVVNLDRQHEDEGRAGDPSGLEGGIFSDRQIGISRDAGSPVSPYELSRVLGGLPIPQTAMSDSLMAIILRVKSLILTAASLFA
jgi:hypothetical protein